MKLTAIAGTALCLLCCAGFIGAGEDKKDEGLSPGMQYFPTGSGSTEILPKDVKVRKQGDLRIVESAGEYSARKIFEMEKRLSEMDTAISQMDTAVSAMNTAIEGLKKKIAELEISVSELRRRKRP